MSENIKHKVTHYYQPTNHACTPAALAIVLSFFGETMTPEQIMEEIPKNFDKQGKEIGSVNQQYASWAINKGYIVTLYSADFELLDVGWVTLDKNELTKKLQASIGKHEIGFLGHEWSKRYIEAYIEFLEKGGQLVIKSYFDTELLDALLQQGPLLAAVSSQVLYEKGRSKDIGLRVSELDDINGSISTHSIVIIGKEEGGYIIADPWKVPGQFTISPDHLLAAMAGAQQQGDNLFFQLSR